MTLWRRIQAKLLDIETEVAALNREFDARYSEGLYDAAAVPAEEALKLSRHYLGDHARTAQSLNDFADIARRKNEPTAAERMYKEALEIRRRKLGPGHRDCGETLNNLGVLYKTTGNVRAAESLFLEAHKIFRRTFGWSHRNTLIPMDHLVGLYEESENWTACERILLKLVEIHRPASGEPTPAYIKTVDRLIALYRRTGNEGAVESLTREEAEPLRKRRESRLDLGVVIRDQAQIERMR